jgi:hypothetical protein
LGGFKDGVGKGISFVVVECLNEATVLGAIGNFGDAQEIRMGDFRTNDCNLDAGLTKWNIDDISSLSALCIKAVDAGGARKLR